MQVSISPAISADLHRFAARYDSDGMFARVSLTPVFKYRPAANRKVVGPRLGVNKARLNLRPLSMSMLLGGSMFAFPAFAVNNVSICSPASTSVVLQSCGAQSPTAVFGPAGLVTFPNIAAAQNQTQFLCFDVFSGQLGPCAVTSSGSQGAQGNQGFQGNQGTTGAQGFQGFQGAVGAQGNQGFQGNQGNTGTQGFQGNIGAQGNQGSQGNQGNTGAQGNQGFQGNVGAQGNQGFQGNMGTQGNQGFQGNQGNTGAQGNQGFQGNVGTQGNQGFQGNMGTQGNQGFQGAVGAQGAPGTSVYAGAQGFQFAVGAQGNQGNTGAQGFQGDQGSLTSGYQIVTSISASDTTAPKTQAATCPGTKLAVGGGGLIAGGLAGGTSINLAIRSSYPSGANQWTSVATATDNVNIAWTLTTYVVCVNP